MRHQICVACARPFPARQFVDGKLRSLYGRRTCLTCNAYGSRDASPQSRVARRPRPVPGQDEWFFRALSAMLALSSPQRASVIARAGVAVFGVSMVLPMFVSGAVPHRDASVVVAATTELQVTAPYELPRMPEPVARSRLVVPTPEPSPQPTPRTTAADVPAVPIEITAVPAAASGSVVTVSWYGPGFYENRLPCWQWLAANGLPIQFLPDTWGVAHKSLPCGTMVTLTHGANIVTVPVVDRGPYVAGREFDLSPRVKAALNCADLCTVVMQVP
ncbi:MAG: hypothetical protein E6J35_04850 [Chloroflexi bacterium]|nr:MAG: hypothetical protein E6J35_04850 [Chloroflexota bacterium]TME87999.1 MAG: hypothetical protein E6I44_07250 [Chloroflexota bacterium]